MKTVPRSLHHWFVFHFFADMAFAIPLFIAPRAIMTHFGFVPEPFTARLVAAALVGIGGTSLLMRNKNLDQYKAMLTVKALWAFTAIVGMILTLIQGGPKSLLLFIGIFIAFWCVWAYYLLKLR